MYLPSKPVSVLGYYNYVFRFDCSCHFEILLPHCLGLLLLPNKLPSPTYTLLSLYGVHLLVTTICSPLHPTDDFCTWTSCVSIAVMTIGVSLCACTWNLLASFSVGFGLRDPQPFGSTFCQCLSCRIRLTNACTRVPTDLNAGLYYGSMSFAQVSCFLWWTIIKLLSPPPLFTSVKK